MLEGILSCVIGGAILIIIVLSALLASRDKELDRLLCDVRTDKQIKGATTAAPVPATSASSKSPAVKQPGTVEIA